MTWEDGEVLAADYLQTHGFRDARVTRRGADQGVDVLGSRVIAQVKFTNATTGRPDVQRLVGANYGTPRHAVFFALAGFTTGAVEYAERCRVALFTYTKSGLVRPVNAGARRIHANYTPAAGHSSLPEVQRPRPSAPPEMQNRQLQPSRPSASPEMQNRQVRQQRKPTSPEMQSLAQTGIILAVIILIVFISAIVELTTG